jgi:hypothetical protein
MTIKLHHCQVIAVQPQLNPVVDCCHAQEENEKQTRKVKAKDRNHKAGEEVLRQQRSTSKEDGQEKAI